MVAFRSPDIKAQAFNLRVMTANIGHGSHFPASKVADIDRVLDRSPAADIVFLQDVRGRDQVRSLARRLGYPFWVIEPSFPGLPGDLAILSTYKLERSVYSPLLSSRSGKGVLGAEIRVGEEAIFLCSVHLDRIQLRPRWQNDHLVFSWSVLLRELGREVFSSTVRSRSVQEFLSWLQAVEAPNTMILGGDFNTVFPSLAIRKMTRQFDDVLWPSLEFFRGSYHPFHFPIKPRIDYIFHSPDLECTSAEIIRDTAGDHYPIEAVFRIRGMSD